MTDRYVGPGGNDGSDGLSWANRKLTLNGVEDTPVVAGDTIYVGPGVYREQLNIDVAGTSGNPITYIGDVSGENTDSVGGIVRATASDNDQTATRGRVISSLAGLDFRTFRGFMFDHATDGVIKSDGSDWIIEDCYVMLPAAVGIWFIGANITDNIIRRCLVRGGTLTDLMRFEHSSTVSNSGILVENCVFMGADDQINIIRVGGITIKNSTFLHNRVDSIQVTTALAGGQTTTVNNCIFFSGFRAMAATVTGEITENYNSLSGLQTPRTNVATGANSNTYPPIFEPPILLDGVQYPWWFGELSEWSQIARIAGAGESTDDLLGVVRPTVSAKKSWGALQLREAERETGTVQTGSAALTLADAGDHQIFVPITATSTTFEVAARYESEYAGTLPRLIVRQPGQADQVDTMVAAADTWETLSLTFAPAADPPYVVVIFRSLNTSVTGDFDTYWDDLDVN